MNPKGTILRVEDTEWGVFAKVMPDVKRGYARGFPIEYFETGTGIHVVLRWFDDKAWHETGNEISPVTICLTSVRERRKMLRARGIL